VIVVDASVLATALSDDGSDGERLRTRLDAESVLCAPEIVDLEVAMAWRRQLVAGWLDEHGAQQALNDLATLNLVRAPHLPLMPRIWDLRDNLTPYDAAYVALAEALDATLLTADAKSTRAPGLRCEVELVQ
jgi:predicted nucleic acid-binding protein